MDPNPKRADKVNRYKPPASGGAPNEDLIPDYMNILGLLTFCSFDNLIIISISGMVFSMCGLMMKSKCCSWLALYCSCISFANSRISDDAKQVIFGFIFNLLQLMSLFWIFLTDSFLIHVKCKCCGNVLFAKSCSNDTAMGCRLTSSQCSSKWE